MICAEGLTPDGIRSQLFRILTSDDFSGRGRLGDLLRFVVEYALDGKAEKLKGYTIALEVFGRDASFDPSRDPIVRIQAGRLRQALEHYYLSSGKHDPIRIDVPKGSYVPVFAKHAEGPADDETPTSRPTIAVLPFVQLDADGHADYFAFGLGEDLSLQGG